jgi:hypothetical protein
MITAADFADVVSGSHTARFRAVLVDGYQDGDVPTGIDLKIIDGEVELDATADIRGTGSLTIAAAWPKARNLSLAPYGSEIYLSRGVDLGAAGVLWAPLGYYRISQVEQGSAAKGPLSLSLDDRMATIIDSRFLAPRQWLQGTTVGEIVSEVVTEIYPNATIVFDDDSDESQLGRSLIAEESRYEVLQTLAEGLGKVFYWDALGRLTFEDQPNGDEPIWQVNAGRGGVLVEADRSLSRKGVYNALVVIGEGADELAPVRAVAYDAQESSPTYFFGPFGQVPRFYSSPFITTQTQAENAAVNLLRQSLGAPYDVGASAVPNPALKPYDVIRVVYDDGTRELHIVDTVSIPLTVEGELNIGTRQSTIVHVGVS